MTITAIDIETTGLNCRNDSIIEIGAVKFDGETVIDTYQTFVNPNRPIPSNIIQLTHIDNLMVRNAPQIMEVIPEVAEFVGTDPVLGQNIGFDLSFLQQGGILKRNRTIDTYELAAVLLPGSPRYALSALSEILGVEVKDAHRALADSMMTMKVYNELLKRIEAMPIALLSSIISATDRSEWSGTRVLKDVFSKRNAAGEFPGYRDPGYTIPTYAQPWAFSDKDMKGTDMPEPLDEDELASILEDGGAFSRCSDHYESRPQQIEMLRSVARSFSNGNHMMIEAGTGTGKSFAYLIPSFFWAIKNQERVVISTNTKNLQDQLIRKDIPELEQALGMELRATVQKGRGNYLCPRRLITMLSRKAQTKDEARVLGKLLVWLSQGGSGDRVEITLNGPADMEVWSRLNAENEGCRPNLCPFNKKGQCPFYSIRKQAQHSHVIIVNHALLLADAVYGRGVLPEYKYLVIDEGHHLEDAATGAMSFKTSQFEMKQLLNEIGSSRKGLVGRLLTDLQPQLSSESFVTFDMLAAGISDKIPPIEEETEILFDCIERFLAEERSGQPLTAYGQQIRLTEHVRIKSEWNEVESAWDNLADSLKELLKDLSDFYSGLTENEDIEKDEALMETVGQFGGAAKNLEDIYENLGHLFLTPQTDFIYWLDIAAKNNRLSLCVAPVNVGPTIEEALWHQKECIILTSATLAADQSFDYMRNRLNADEADTMSVGSPFDYENNALLFVPNDIPDPNNPGLQRVLENMLVDLVRTVGGRTLVLFTSYAQLKKTSNEVSQRLTKDGIVVYEQGEGVSPTALLETFRKTPKAVLMGTRSFWEGVDIRGEQLSVVVIAKLPFDVPSDPVIAARAESFDNPFVEYSIPEAILKFRQGFGRLIRSKTDRGLVVVMDTRLMKKQYGKEFLRSIPPCKKITGSVRDLPTAARKWLKIS